MDGVAEDVFMVTPRHYDFNIEAAATDHFMRQFNFDRSEIIPRAMKEFEHIVSELRRAGVNVVVLEDSADPPKPDAVYPNNWISTHSDGTIVLFPMCVSNRRPERREDIVAQLTVDYHFQKCIDLSHFEQQSKYLEGTGSLVLDRRNLVAYACLSNRTHKEPLTDFGSRLGFTIVAFHASLDGAPIYHTNVMLSVGRTVAVICSASITDEAERRHVLDSLHACHLTVVDVSLDQMRNFACNVLLLRAREGCVWAMSQRARDAFTPEQTAQLLQDGCICSAPLDTIEHGGGSARCMIAEIFPPV
jgi:hypothetical protein